MDADVPEPAHRRTRARNRRSNRQALRNSVRRVLHAARVSTEDHARKGPRPQSAVHARSAAPVPIVGPGLSAAPVPNGRAARAILESALIHSRAPKVAATHLRNDDGCGDGAVVVVVDPRPAADRLPNSRIP